MMKKDIKTILKKELRSDSKYNNKKDHRYVMTFEEFYKKITKGNEEELKQSSSLNDRKNYGVCIDGINYQKKEAIIKVYEKILEKKGVEELEKDGSIFGLTIQSEMPKEVRKSNYVHSEKKGFYVNINDSNALQWISGISTLLNKYGEEFDQNKSYIWFSYEYVDEKEENEMSIEAQMNDVNVIVENEIKCHRQVIFTGAPGTGKTYVVRDVIKELCTNKQDRTVDASRYKFVQFHPSYDYTDFVEGLRPVTIEGENNPTFVRLDGIFKKFCRMIVEESLNELEEGLVKKLSDKTNREEQQTEFKSIYEEIEKKYKPYKDGDNDCVPEYYFIIDEINRADLSKVFGELMFGLEESYRGIEHRFDTQYMNLRTYEIYENGYAKPMGFDCFEKGFFIPCNLHIIGTMNDIDRSVDSMDFALRRRFSWKEIKANDIMVESLNEIYTKKAEELNLESNEENKGKISKLSNTIGEKVKNMNNIICDVKNEDKSKDKGSKLGLTEAYHIGPAYFKDLEFDSYLNVDETNRSDNETNNRSSLKEILDDKTYELLERIFDNNIASILREYTRGRKQEDVEDLVKACWEELLG